MSTETPAAPARKPRARAPKAPASRASAPRASAPVVVPPPQASPALVQGLAALAAGKWDTRLDLTHLSGAEAELGHLLNQVAARAESERDAAAVAIANPSARRAVEEALVGLEALLKHGELSAFGAATDDPLLAPLLDGFGRVIDTLRTFVTRDQRGGAAAVVVGQRGAGRLHPARVVVHRAGRRHPRDDRHHGGAQARLARRSPRTPARWPASPKRRSTPPAPAAAPSASSSTPCSRSAPTASRCPSRSPSCCAASSASAPWSR